MTYSKYVKVPIQMCNTVAKECLEKPFRLFIYLKLMYPSGKTEWDNQEKQFAAFILCNHVKTIENNFKRLLELGWLDYDEEYKYWRIHSFDRIREDNYWGQRRAYCFKYQDLCNVQATLGAIIYTQAYKSYCRKYYKRKSNVLRKRSADKSFTPSCDTNRPFAQVSVIIINKFYGISINKAVRLKQKAEKHDLIIVKKQYYALAKDQVYAAKKSNHLRDEPMNIVYRNGKNYIQLIDRIYSDLYFKKRKKLETLLKDINRNN